MPLVHVITEFHKELYALGLRLPKRDKLGLHAKTESISLEMLRSSISAAFESKENKAAHIKTLRIQTEISKHLLRSEFNLGIINEKYYIELQARLQEISKMANGWLKFLNQSPA